METAPQGVAASQPPGAFNTLQRLFWTGPSHPVAKRLQEGDEVAGFQVLHVPGHSPGHVAYWRERDRVLILGDVAANINERRPWQVGLHEPLPRFTPDPAQNRESLRRLGALEPALCLFGHGPPVRDPAAFSKFAASLPAE
jgi:glyoxylase-like metal-dependent hydrolase (beta-lactamase superfamily II)